MLTFLVARKKAIIALIGAIATWAPLALADGHVTLMEWQALVIAMLGVLGVHEVANVPPSTPLGLPTPQTALALAEVLGRPRSAKEPPTAPAADHTLTPATSTAAYPVRDTAGTIIGLTSNHEMRGRTVPIGTQVPPLST